MTLTTAMAALAVVAACKAASVPANVAPPAQPAPPAASPSTPAPPAPSSPPTLPAPPPAPARHATVDALLDAAEQVSSQLKDFNASVLLETTDDVTGDTERRNGHVVFVQSEGKPETRRFAVVFATFVDGAGRMDERPVRYLYADGWLTEADFTQRTLIRRQLAHAGEAFDPLKPGEGPVPLPIGQRKADVLRRFEVALADKPTAASLAKLNDVQGVALTPRPGMADRDLVKATVWYDLRTMAPVGIEAERKNGRTVVRLGGPAVNAGLNDEQRALLTLAAGQTAGWRVDERPLPAKEP